jgi:hypothetical protein
LGQIIQYGMCSEWPCGDRGRPKLYIRGFKNLGPATHMDCLSRYFIRNIEATGLLDIEPTKLTPTWRNKRTREDKIAKRLDHFLISKGFLDEVIQVRQWVASGGDSDHNPVVLEVALSRKNHPVPFKLNPKWLKVEEFVKKIKDVGIPLMNI